MILIASKAIGEERKRVAMEDFNCLVRQHTLLSQHDITKSNSNQL